MEHEYCSWYSLTDVLPYKTRLWVQFACLDKGLGFATIEGATEIGNLWESLSTTTSKLFACHFYGMNVLWPVT